MDFEGGEHWIEIPYQNELLYESNVCALATHSLFLYFASLTGPEKEVLLAWDRFKLQRYRSFNLIRNPAQSARYFPNW